MSEFFQLADRIWFVIFFLLGVVIFGVAVVGRVPLRVLLNSWLGSIAIFAGACAAVVASDCSCPLLQVLALDCPSCMSGHFRSYVIPSEAFTAAGTLAVIVRALISICRLGRTR